MQQRTVQPAPASGAGTHAAGVRTGPRAGGNRVVLEAACSIMLAVAIVGLAEIAAGQRWISEMILPRPSAVFLVLVQGLRDGYFIAHIASSLVSLVVGFVAAFFTAIVLAGLISSHRFIEKVLTPYVVAFQSLPKVAIAPLVVLWLGFGELSKITIVAIVCFFPIMVNTIQGLRLRNRDHDEVLRSFGATGWQHFRYMRLPHAVPYIFAGIHIGVIFALIGVVVAEFVGTSSGIGFAMLQAKSQFDVPAVYACLIILMAMGLGLHFITAFVERRISAAMGEVPKEIA